MSSTALLSQNVRLYSNGRWKQSQIPGQKALGMMFVQESLGRVGKYGNICTSSLPQGETI